MRRAIALVAAALLFSGCARATQSDLDSGSKGKQLVLTETSGLREWPGDTNSARVSVKQLTKPTLLNFWATWCGPCAEELPILAASPDANLIVGINTQDVASAPDAVAAGETLLADAKVTYKQLVLSDYPWAIALGVAGLPVTLAVNADGQVVARHDGPVDAATLADLVSKAKGQS